MGLSVRLNGIDYRATDRYTIKEQVGQPAPSTIEVQLEDNPFPVTHTRVEILDNGIPFYSGLISNVDTPVYSTKFETDIVPLNVISLDTIFTRRLVSEAWENKFTHEIVLDIFNEYLVEENITLGIIEEFDNLYDKYVVPSLKMSDIFQELGEAVGAVANIDKDRVFNFVTKSSLSMVAPPDKITKLKMSESGHQLKTVQRVSGAKAETSLQTEVVTWVTGQTSILLGYQVAEEPNVTINASPVEVGIQGQDEDNVNKVFLWAYGNNALVLNSNATNPPVATDIVSVIFKGFYNIEVITDKEDLKQEIADISGTSGKIESIVIDTSITTQQDGENLGNNLLQESSIRDRTVTLECKDLAKSTLLTTWELIYPELNITGSFVIVERTIRDFYDDVYKINVKLKNRSFYSRYGEAFNKNTKEINNLSVRTDDFVLKTSSIYETITMVDTYEANQQYMAFTPGTTDILSPAFFAGSTVSGGI